MFNVNSGQEWSRVVKKIVIFRYEINEWSRHTFTMIIWHCPPLPLS
jgi:hypothetical protein